MVIGERQLAGHRLEGAAGLDEGHHLAFVVAGAARDDDLAAVGQRRDARRERRRVPQIERIDRLHVVVAVEQHARALAVAARRRPCRRRSGDLRSDARWFRSRCRPDPWPQTRRPPGTPCCRPGRSRSTGCAGTRTAARGSGRDRRRSFCSTAGRACEGVMSVLWRLSGFERSSNLRNKRPASKGNDPHLRLRFNDVDRPRRTGHRRRCRPWSRARWRGRPSCPSCRRAICRCRPRSGRRPGW